MDLPVDFAALVQRHQRELRVHCYRMVGSFDEAEDMVQETMLRAWRGGGGVEGGVPFPAWVYWFATNLCLNSLGRAPPPALPQGVGGAGTPGTPPSRARTAPGAW